MIRDHMTLRFELNRAKERLVTMINADAEKLGVELDVMLSEALDSDNVLAQVEKEVEAVVREVIATELKNYFQYGYGRAFIKNECHKAIDRILGAREDSQ